MDRHKQYDTIIKDKLERLECPDMSAMWADMQARLDVAMPINNRRRRIIGWLWSNKNKFSLVFVVLAVSYVTLFTIGNMENEQLANNPGSKPAGGSFRQDMSHTTANTQGQNEKLSQNTNAPRAKEPVHPLAHETGTMLVTEVNDKNITLSAQQGSLENRKPLKMDLIPASPGKVEKSNLQPGSIQRQQPGENIIELKQTKQLQLASTNMPSIVLPGTQNENAKLENIPGGNSFMPVSILSGVYDRSVQPGISFGPWFQNQGITTSIFRLDSNAISKPLVARNPAPARDRSIIIGVSANYNIPLSGQEMSTIGSNGKKYSIIDFLPSAFVQYPLGQKFYLQGEFQFSSPQYTPKTSLSAKTRNINASMKEKQTIFLTKLYYLNVPVSINYRPLQGLSVGTGVQFSYLRKSVLETEFAVWEKMQSGSWNKTSSVKEITVKSNPSVERRNSGNGSGSSSPDLDTVAQSFRSSDWRLLADVNYKWKKLSLGFRFNTGLNSYFKTQTGNAGKNIKDRNESFQLYLRYDLFRLPQRRGAGQPTMTSSK